MQIFRNEIKPSSKIRLDYTHKDMLPKLNTGNDIGLHDNLDDVKPYMIMRATDKELAVRWKPYGTSGIYTILD